MENIEKVNELILPAIAVRGSVPIPNSDFRIEVGRTISLNAIDLAEKENQGNIILLIQKDALVDDVTSDDLYEYGVLAKISLKLKLPNNNYKVKFSVQSRVKIKRFVEVKPTFLVSYTLNPSYSDNLDEELTLSKMVAKEIVENQVINFNNAEEIIRGVQQGITTDELCDLIANNFKNANVESRYRYVKEASISERLKFILEDLAKEKMIADIENKINSEVKRSVDESQKEFYLREKMKAIQNELGDKAKREEEIEELREKILAAKMPKQTEEKMLDELNRYASTPSQMAESNIIKAYLDFVVSLPWYQESEDNKDLSKVVEELNKNHYALDKVKDRIIEYLSVKIMTNRNPQTILCLVGPPGVGKTSLAMSIAKALNRKFVKATLGGVKDESEIRGHRRTYIGALPGRIMKGMRDAQTVNPVFLLDEIDKMASDYKGDPASAMLEVLDPQQNNSFSDHYVEEPYDLSKVLFVITANYIENIPAPLRDRMEIVELSSYTEFEKFNIAKLHLINRNLEAHGLKDSQFSITDGAIYYIIQHYTREAGVRELNRVIGSLVRKSIKEILLNKVEKVDVTVDNIEHFLGKIKYTNNKANEKDQIGVVTGLAYTAFGGDTLDVEVTYYKGKGGLVLTGKLGDVMKESAQIAYSYVRAHADEFNIDRKIFEENDIHVHVPEGATPKDGPSAGVTLTTAIVSALTNRYVDSHIGMTGEVTLRGNVLPIGGLKEKSIAAHRSGLKRILIPKENKRDIDDIPQEVQKELEIIPVSHVSEVLKYALK